VPELPEVETTRRGVAPALVGRRVAAVHVYDRRLRWPVPDDLERELQGRELVAVDRRSKYLLFRWAPRSAGSGDPPSRGRKRVAPRRGETAAGGGPFPVTVGPTTTTFTDAAVTKKVKYVYRITALNSVGESPFSAEVNATAR